MDKGKHGFVGQKCAHTASSPFAIRQVCPAGLSLSDRIFAPTKPCLPLFIDGNLYYNRKKPKSHTIFQGRPYRLRWNAQKRHGIFVWLVQRDFIVLLHKKTQNGLVFLCKIMYDRDVLWDATGVPKNKGGKNHAESISIAPVPGDDTDSVGAGHLGRRKAGGWVSAASFSAVTSAKALPTSASARALPLWS